MEARMRIDPAVRQMTWYITVFVILLSVLMELVFLLLHRWDYTVLLGNLLGAAIAIVNFFLMGLAVQKAVDQEEKEASGIECDSGADSACRCSHCGVSRLQ